jgi:hypothetical protein
MAFTYPAPGAGNGRGRALNIHNEEVEPGAFELPLEHQEGGRRLLGTRWRTVAVLAPRRCAALEDAAERERAAEELADILRRLSGARAVRSADERRDEGADTDRNKVC